jgi:hypothetical protein
MAGMVHMGFPEPGKCPIRHPMLMNQKIWAVIAWGALGVIVFATLSPLGLRPHLASQHREHFAAFAAVGLLFGLAYRRPVLVLVLLCAAAVVLELLQLLTPDRHGRAIDVAFKLAGAGAGACASWLLMRLALKR